MSPLDRMRAICRDLLDVTEAPHFGDTMFKSQGRAFASCGDKKGVAHVVVKLEPAQIAALLAANDRASRYPRAKDCVVIEITAETDWDELRRLVLESHRLTAKPATKAKKAARKRTKKS